MLAWASLEDTSLPGWTCICNSPRRQRMNSLPNEQAATLKREEKGLDLTTQVFLPNQPITEVVPLPRGIRGQAAYLNGGPFICKLETEKVVPANIT